MTLCFSIKGQQLIRNDESKIAGFARNYIHAMFNFDQHWIDLYKYALFSEPNGAKHVVPLGYGKVLSCKIPKDVLSNAVFYVSVFADDLLTSTQESIIIYPSGYISDIDDLEEGDFIKGKNKNDIYNYQHMDDEFPYERTDYFEREEHPYI